MSLTKATYSMIDGAPINVKDFGAIGDGVADDTAAIQAALDYQQTLTTTSTAATGETLGTAPVVFFPEGQYLISASLNIKSRYAWLLGEQSTLKKSTVFTGTTGLQMAGNAWRIHIESLQFQDFAVGLYLDSSNLNSGQVGIHNCGFFGCTDRGLWLDVQSTATIIKDCIFRANKHDLWVETGDLVSWEGGWIQRKGNQLTDNYDGAVVNYGAMFVKNVVGVPQPETLVTEPAWFANYGNLDIDGFRFGGESGGFCAVNNFTSGSPWATQDPKRFVVIRNCQLYIGASQPAVRLFYAPNLIVLDKNSGLTGSGAYAVGWSSSVSAPDQALRLPSNTTQARWFNIVTNNSGQDSIVDTNLLAYATTKRQLRLFSDVANTQNVIFDYLQATVATGDVYGTIEWKGYDSSSPSVVGRRGAIIGRASGASSQFELAFLTAGTTAVAERLVLESLGVLRPAADNTQQLGTASFRWSEVFAGNGTINTSDGREKQDVAALDDAEKRVAVALKGLIKKFRFKDAVERKGDAARIHVGVIAQEIVAAFAAEGLDANQYGLFCYDEWDAKEAILDKDGNVVAPALKAGSRYGIRYEELLAFIVAAL